MGISESESDSDSEYVCSVFDCRSTCWSTRLSTSSVDSIPDLIGDVIDGVCPSIDFDIISGGFYFVEDCALELFDAIFRDWIFDIEGISIYLF